MVNLITFVDGRTGRNRLACDGLDVDEELRPRPRYYLGGPGVGRWKLQATMVQAIIRDTCNLGSTFNDLREHIQNIASTIPKFVLL